MRRIIVLGVLVAVAVLLSNVGAKSAQQPPRPSDLHVQVFDTRDNLYFVTGAGTNTLVLDGVKGVVVIDPKLPGLGHALLTAIAGVSEKPVTTIINTHAHVDHTGSNAELDRKSTRLNSSH